MARVRRLGKRRAAARGRVDAITRELADAVADAYREGYPVCLIRGHARIARRTFSAMTLGVQRGKVDQSERKP